MRRFLATIVALCALFATSVALATTVVKLDFDQLVEASDVIVVGEIASVDAFVQDGRVFTSVDVKVRETLKGSPKTKLQIVHIGGRTKELATRVAGMPSFRQGELALLFLEQPKKVSHHVVTGLAQGKMALESDENGKLRLKRDTQQLNMVDLKKPSQADTNLAKPMIPAPKIDTLDAARARIAALVAGSSSTSTTEE